MPKVFRDRLGGTGTIEDGEFVPYASQSEADEAVPAPQKKAVPQEVEDEDPDAESAGGEDSAPKKRVSRQQGPVTETSARGGSEVKQKTTDVVKPDPSE